MKAVQMLLCLALVGMTAGCVTVHKERITNFRLSGVIEFQDSPGGQPKEALVKLVDIDMDDAKARRGQVLSSFQASQGHAFSVVNTYLWGSSSKAYEDAIVGVQVSSQGCQDFQKQYRLGELQRQDRALQVELGTVTLKCR